MGHKYTGYYRYEGGDDRVTRFRHIATDRVLEVTNRSLVGLPRDMKNPSLILRTGFVEWNGEWWLSGQITSYEDSEDLIGQITGDDDEYNLFEPDDDLPDDEQQIILTDILSTTVGEEGQDTRRVGYRLAGHAERRDRRRLLHRPGRGRPDKRTPVLRRPGPTVARQPPLCHRIHKTINTLTLII